MLSPVEQTSQPLKSPHAPDQAAGAAGGLSPASPAWLSFVALRTGLPAAAPCGVNGVLHPQVACASPAAPADLVPGQGMAQGQAEQRSGNVSPTGAIAAGTGLAAAPLAPPAVQGQWHGSGAAVAAAGCVRLGSAGSSATGGNAAAAAASAAVLTGKDSCEQHQVHKPSRHGPHLQVHGDLAPPTAAAAMHGAASLPHGMLPQQGSQAAMPWLFSPRARYLAGYPFSGAGHAVASVAAPKLHGRLSAAEAGHGSGQVDEASMPAASVARAEAAARAADAAAAAVAAVAAAAQCESRAPHPMQQAQHPRHQQQQQQQQAQGKHQHREQAAAVDADRAVREAPLALLGSGGSAVGPSTMHYPQPGGRHAAHTELVCNVAHIGSPVVYRPRGVSVVQDNGGPGVAPGAAEGRAEAECEGSRSGADSQDVPADPGAAREAVACNALQFFANQH